MGDSGGNRPWLYCLVSDATAQSEPLAVILLVGITITGGGLVVVLGGNAIDRTTETADVSQAEHAMTQLDSKASLVAHGSSERQRVSLDQNNRGTLRIDEDAGWMRVRIINGTSGNVTVMNESLGALEYDRAESTIAYQGGGVWRGRDDRSVMVSPPEFHYQGGTLTLPLVLVRGESVSDGEAVVSQRGPTNARFPNATLGRSNPLTNGTVNVTVGSRYYRAWGAYFAERTSGEVSYNHANDTVTISLIAPFPGRFGNVVAATQQGGITVNGNDPPPVPSETGVDYPVPDDDIEDRIDDCESGGCNAWTTNVNSGGTYYLDGDFGGGMTIDSSSRVELVVNGSFKTGNIDVLGTGNVSVYVREDFDVNGEVNDGADSGNASQFRTFVHSDGDVDFQGGSKYVGLIYAPGSPIDLNGGGANSPNLVGGLVGETITINGNPNDFQYDPSINDVTLHLSSDLSRIVYLHVSVTEVEVDS